MEQRTEFVFRREYFDAIEKLSDKEQLECYQRIMRVAFQEPSTADFVVSMVKSAFENEKAGTT